MGGVVQHQGQRAVGVRGVWVGAGSAPRTEGLLAVKGGAAEYVDSGQLGLRAALQVQSSGFKLWCRAWGRRATPRGAIQRWWGITSDVQT